MAVMYLGKVVEIGSSAQVYDSPQHPYTQALVAANPIPDPVAERQRQRQLIQGEIGSPVNPKPGCRFAPRCPHAMEKCRQVTPELRDVGGGRLAACHLLAH
jgi:oligopeptide transport system ATP-binding protein